ncbi:MAG: hypothetical protein IIW48_06755 [Clostridia bacterium]|nr:hypothetical protein [Clostridia bacterium]
MKKLVVLLVALVVALSVALAVVLAKDSSGGNGAVIDTEIQSKIDSGIGKLEAEKRDAWREAYISFVENYYGEYSDFNEERIFLGYVDSDDIPELFISQGGSHACAVEVYTFDNNIVTELCVTGSFGSVRYLERQGFVCGDYTGMGVSTCWIYSVEDGYVKELYNTFSNEGWVGDESAPEIRINGIDVTGEELDEFLDPYFGEKSVLLFDDEINVGYGRENDEYKDYINSFGK